MKEERVRILKMLEEGKISAEEAENLLSALEGGAKGKPSGKKLRWIRINVFDKEGGKQTMNASIPLSLASIAMKFVPLKVREKMESEGLDVDSIVEDIKAGVQDGKIVDIDEEAEKITISIE